MYDRGVGGGVNLYFITAVDKREVTDLTVQFGRGAGSASVEIANLAKQHFTFGERLRRLWIWIPVFSCVLKCFFKGLVHLYLKTAYAEASVEKNKKGSFNKVK